MSDFLVLYQIPETRKEKVKDFLRDAGFPAVFHHEDDFEELAVSYTTPEKIKKLEDSETLLRVHKRVLEMQYFQKRFFVHNTYSFFEIAQWARDTNVRLVSFQEHNQTMYGVIAEGVSKNLQKFSQHFKAFSEEDERHAEKVNKEVFYDEDNNND